MLISIGAETCKIISFLILGISFSFRKIVITVTVRATVYVGWNQPTKSTQMILHATLDWDSLSASYPIPVILKGYNHSMCVAAH